MTGKGYKVPRKRPRAEKYSAVWQHLSTIEEYDSLSSLRAELAKKFGDKGTPSKSELHRHLQRNKEVKSE